MLRHALVTYLKDGKAEFTLCKEDGRHWLECPPSLVLRDDTDLEHVGRILHQVLPFLTGDRDLDDGGPP